MNLHKKKELKMTYKAVFKFKMYGTSYNEGWTQNANRFHGALPEYAGTSADLAGGKMFANGLTEQDKEILKYLLRDLKGALRFYKEV